MLNNIKLPSSTIRPVLHEISMLIPAGTKTIPVGITCEESVLRLTCTSTCNYEVALPVDCNFTCSLTIAYSAIHEMLGSTDEVTLEFQGVTGLAIKTDRFVRIFNTAYSIVSPLEYTSFKTLPLVNKASVHSLKCLTKTPLSSMYKKEPPIEICDGVAVLKYGNVWLQVRVAGFPVNVTMTQSCVKTVMSYGPDSYFLYGDDTLVLAKGHSMLFVPVKKCNKLTSIKDVIPNSDTILKYNLSKLADCVKLHKEMGCKRVGVTMFTDGICFSGETAEGSIRVNYGACSDYVCTFNLPTDLASMCFTLFSETTMECIYSEGVLCVRNQGTAIVIHVLA